MKDSTVRSAFHNSILSREHQCNDTFVVDELGLKNGGARADIAVLNGKLIGYEIKTERDTLNRLSHQVQAYNEVFDENYIITCNKHLFNALEDVPVWWGVYLIKEISNSEYTFEKFREAKKNFQKNTYSIAQLLWKDEVIEIITNTLDYKIKSNQTKSELYELLASNFTADHLTHIALVYLKTRDSWRINR